MSTQLSPHFQLEEFLSPRDPVRHLPAGVLSNLGHLAKDVLEPLRVAVGRPLKITSGWRSEGYNHSVGGATHSQHVEGNAADLEAALLVDQIELLAKASRIPAVGGLGYYPGRGFIHVDRRPRVSGKITTWAQIDGRYVSLPANVRAKLLLTGAVDLL